MNKFVKAFAVVFPLTFFLAACDGTPAQPSARVTEQRAAQEQQQKFNQTAPIPVLPMSQERNNLVKRATRINVQNMSGCVTLFDRGVLVASFVVAGKVSSLNSYLLSSEQIVNGTSGGYTQSLVVEQPDIDGAYGNNADGIFFFTADTDAYVEWKGSYLYTDQCLVTTSSPLLTQSVNE